MCDLSWRKNRRGTCSAWSSRPWQGWSWRTCRGTSVHMHHTWSRTRWHCSCHHKHHMSLFPLLHPHHHTLHSLQGFLFVAHSTSEKNKRQKWERFLCVCFMPEYLIWIANSWLKIRCIEVLSAFYVLELCSLI